MLKLQIVLFRNEKMYMGRGRSQPHRAAPLCSITCERCARGANVWGLIWDDVGRRGAARHRCRARGYTGNDGDVNRV